MREADNKSIFLSVVGVYVVRTSSLNDKHSCQLFRRAASFSSLVLLSSSVSTANLSCLLATTFSSLRFLFNFTSLQSFVSGQALFLVGYLFSHFRILSSILSLSFLCSSVSEALIALSFKMVLNTTTPLTLTYRCPDTPRDDRSWQKSRQRCS